MTEVDPPAQWMAYYDKDGTSRAGLKSNIDPDGGGGGGQTLIVADDTDVTVPASPGLTVVLFTAVTAARNVNLPPASFVPMTVIIKDVNRQATNDNPITPVAAGGDAIVASFFHIGTPVAGVVAGMMALANDGVNSWADVAEASGTDGYLYGLILTLGNQVTNFGTALTAQENVFAVAPVDSQDALAGFGNVAIGTAVQNVLAQAVLVNVTIPVTAASGGSIVMGTDASATPPTDPATPALSGAQVVTVTAIVPPAYFLLVDTSGTITVGTPVTTVTPL